MGNVLENGNDRGPLEPLGVAVGELVSVPGEGQGIRAALPRPTAVEQPQAVPESPPPTEADPVEVALVNALRQAVEAKQWGTVETLAHELEARRERHREARRKGRQHG